LSGEYDAVTGDCVTAFQRHFRPLKVDGIGDPASLATLEKLIAELDE